MFLLKKDYNYEKSLFVEMVNSYFGNYTSVNMGEYEMKKSITFYLCGALCLCLIGCGKEVVEPTEIDISKNITKSISQNVVLDDNLKDNSEDTIQTPSKEDVLAMRETVLASMSNEDAARLTENIKVANLQMESAYLNDNIFDKLADKDSAYWLYFDQKGDIQLGWWYKGAICSMDEIMSAEDITEEEFYETYDEPGIVYNRFDAKNFVDLIEDMMSTVHDENLRADLQQLIDLTNLAAETHDVQYANEIYKILHDMDYFLLRYGIEDVGKYTRDDSLVGKYYGVLNVYSEE